STAETLPATVGELHGFELTIHCDRCGRHHRLHPAAKTPHARTLLVSLVTRLRCRATRDGEACTGQPRRLILASDDRRWVREASGVWTEDDTAYWEDADFDAHREAAARPVIAQPTARAA